MGAELAILAGGMQAGNSIGQGLASRQSFKTEAALLNEEARQEALRGKQEQEQLARDFDNLASTQRAQFAKSGVALTGTPLDIIQETISDKNDNIAQSKINTNRRVSSLRTRSRIMKQQGRNALLSGVLSGIGSGASTAAQANKSQSLSSANRPQ